MLNQHHAYGINFQCVEASIDPSLRKPTYWCDQQHMFLNIANVAAYFVNASANTVTIEIDPSIACREIVNTWLYGTVLAYLLQFHDYLVLHGSAVLMNQKAVIFSGHSGVGKSTLAFALSERNYSILTDDLVVIRQNQSGQFELISSISHSKLWQDVLAHFGKEPKDLKPVLNKPGKYLTPLSGSSLNEPVPISSFYELNLDEKSEHISCTPVYQLEAFELLIKNTYRYEMLKPLGKLAKHFAQISELLKNMRLFRITRPASLLHLEALIKTIEASERG